MKKLSIADYQALAEFRYQIRKFLHFSDAAIEGAGLERSQYQLMLTIKGMPDGVRPRIRDIADRMLIQHHSAVELIDRLETGGYVRRERGAERPARGVAGAHGKRRAGVGAVGAASSRGVAECGSEAGWGVAAGDSGKTSREGAPRGLKPVSSVGR